MNEGRFSTILEECLQRLDRGEDLPELLGDYPALADELKPLLLVAMASRAFPVPVPCQTAQRLGRNQMLAEMNALEIKKAFRKRATIPASSRLIGGLVSFARRRGYNRLAYSYRLAMVSLVLVLSGGYFTISASASSQPGDLLYNLKLGLQRAGLSFPFMDEDPGSDGYQPLQVPPEPWEFGRYFWGLEGIYSDYLDLGVGVPDSFDDGYVFTADQDDMDPGKEDVTKDEIKDLKDLEKELAEAEKDAEKDLKEEEKDLAEDEKEADKDLKEEEKEETEDENEVEEDLKEDEKEADKDLKEELKELAEAERESEKDDKKADKGKMIK